MKEKAFVTISQLIFVINRLFMKPYFLALLLFTIVTTSCSKSNEDAQQETPISEVYAKFAGTWKMTYLACSEACGPVDLPLSRNWVLTLSKDGDYIFKDDGQTTASYKYTIKIIDGKFVMDDTDEIKIDENGMLVISTTNSAKSMGPSSSVKKYIKVTN